MAYPCLHFTRNHEDIKSNTPYPEASIRRIKGLLYMKILEDIKRGPYSKKAQYAVSNIGKDSDSGLLVYKEPLSNASNCDRISVSRSQEEVSPKSRNDMPLRDKTIIALINKPAFYQIIHG
ncbi:hypothetical protein Tco_0226895 [Tanacetum coccineum]